MELSRGALGALRNLSQKKQGRPVDWIAIADARALTELGLAERNRSGWQITAAGETALNLAESASASARPDNVLVMPDFGAGGQAGQPIFRSPLPQ